MPGLKELRRGVALGVYRDVEKETREERRVQVAEEGAALAQDREQRMVGIAERDAASRELRDKLAINEALTKDIEFRNQQDALDLDNRIKQKALEAIPRLKAVNPMSPDFTRQLSEAIGDDPRVETLLKDRIQWNVDSHKSWRAKQEDEQKRAAEWEVANGIDYPRKPDGSLNHVAAGQKMREAAKARGLAERTAVTGGVTFESPKPELATVVETTESKNTPADINLPETTTRRAVTSKQPATEIKATTPMTGKEFLDSLKR